MPFDAIGGLFGGGDDKASPSSHEEALEQISKSQFQRHEDVFEDLNRDLERRGERDETDTLQARANADTMQRMGGPNVQPDGQVKGRGRAGLKALAEGQRSAANQAEDMRTDRRSNAMAMRTGQAQEAVEGLSTAGEIATRRSLADLEADMRQTERRKEAMGTATGMGMAGYEQYQLGQARQGAIDDLPGTMEPIGV